MPGSIGGLLVGLQSNPFYVNFMALKGGGQESARQAVICTLLTITVVLGLLKMAAKKVKP